MTASLLLGSLIACGLSAGCGGDAALSADVDVVLDSMGIPHVYAESDVDALYALLQSIGADILDAPAEYPQYGAGYYAVFFADPDGLKLEYVHKP